MLIDFDYTELEGRIVDVIRFLEKTAKSLPPDTEIHLDITETGQAGVPYFYVPKKEDGN